MSQSKVSISTVNKELLALLTSEGFRPSFTDDGVIEVKVEGGIFFISTEETDVGFFGITYPNFWAEDNNTNASRMIDACNKANSQSKFAKCVSLDNSAHCMIQALHPNAESFVNNFPRYVSAIKFGVNSFVESMNSTTTRH